MLQNGPQLSYSSSTLYYENIKQEIRNKIHIVYHLHKIVYIYVKDINMSLRLKTVVSAVKVNLMHIIFTRIFI